MKKEEDGEKTERRGRSEEVTMDTCVRGRAMVVALSFTW